MDAVFYELCLASDAVFDSCVLKKRVDFAKNRRWRGIFTMHTCDARVHILHGRSFGELRLCVRHSFCELRPRSGRSLKTLGYAMIYMYMFSRNRPSNKNWYHALYS